MAFLVTLVSLKLDMKTLNIDILNFGLILISFVLACVLPFELFLFGYAVLGPLHYLTETNWIVNKKYFVVNTYWKYIVGLGGILYALPYVYTLPKVNAMLSQTIISDLIEWGSPYTNSIMLLTLLNAFLFLFIKPSKALWLGLVLTVLISIVSFNSELYSLVIGLLLPTIIHVYLFTIFFMGFGYQKQPTSFGVANILLMFLLPFLLIVVDIDWIQYHFSDTIKGLYVSNNFHVLNAYLAKIFGVYDELKFFFYEKMDIKIQIFIAFAYIYHYLNWFSKTTVIGWHKQLTTKKSILILSLWALILMSYGYDFRLGFVMSIFFSVVHVMLEFPLNMITINSIFKRLK